MGEEGDNMLGVLSVQLLLMVADTPIQFARPIGKWTLEYEDDACILHRSFKNAGRPSALALETDPLRPLSAAPLWISLIAPRSTYGIKRGEATITLHPTGIRYNGRYQSTARSKGLTIVRLYLRDLKGTAIETMTGVSIDAEGLATIHLAAGATSATRAAMETCRRSLLTSWNVDPDEFTKVSTPARALSADKEIVKEADYPSAAIAANASGTTTIRLAIGLNGRATDCATVRSSGNADLDKAACAAFEKRARFEPASGTDGRPMVTHQLRSIAWTLWQPAEVLPDVFM